MLMPMLLALMVAQPPIMALEAPPTSEAGSSDAEAYAAALAELEAAEAASDVHEGLDIAHRLERAIEAIVAFGPQLADDDAARETLLYARLSLARNYYIMEPSDFESADAIVDSVLRTSRDIDPKITARFRPYFGDRYDAKLAELDSEGKASIEFICHVECEVAVDFEPVHAGRVDVYLGTHVVLLRALDGSLPTQERRLPLTEPGRVEVVVFGEAQEPPDTTVPPPELVEPRLAQTPEAQTPEAQTPEVQTPRRKQRSQRLVRGLEIGGMVAGAGTMAASVGVFAFDGRCRDPGDSRDRCPRIWEATPAGAATLAVGGALLVTSVVFLVVDLHRTRERAPKRERQVALRTPGLLHF